MAKKDVEAIYPLSPSQHGMLLETLASASAANASVANASGMHIEQSVWSLRGNLNLSAFERAWQRVVERHPILRTAFIWKSHDEPLQIVFQQVKIPKVQQDWRGFSLPQQQRKLEEYIKADRRQGFNLARAPLLRLAVFQTDDNEFQIVQTFHHILVDGWSWSIVIKELLAFYEAFCREQHLSLEPSRSYRDYISWQRRQNLSEAETFWRKKLQGFTTTTRMRIAERWAGAVSSSGQEKLYSDQTASLPASTTAVLKSLLRQKHLTFNILVQGVWGLLLSCYSGDLDVVFGATVSGRPADLPGIESMVGLFFNTLPVRILVSPEASLWSWLMDIQDQQVAQKSYEHCSAGQIHQWSEVPASLPLYESVLVFENYPDHSPVSQSSVQSIDIYKTRSIGAQTRYAINILVLPDTELRFKVVYDSSRFASSDIILTLEHFLTLLESVAAFPEQDLKTLVAGIPLSRQNGDGSRLSDYIMLDTLPLTPDGKIARPELGVCFVAPRDEVELRLAEIWEEVLGIHPIGVKDSFFDLGKHSLVALSLFTRIQKTFGKNFPLAILFEAPTVEQLANIIRVEESSPKLSSLVAVQSGGSMLPLFCIHGCGGEVLFFADLMRRLGPEQPFYALRARGMYGEKAPFSRVEDMAAYYIEEMRKVQTEGPYFILGAGDGGLVAFEVCQQLLAKGQKVALLAMVDTYCWQLAESSSGTGSMGSTLPGSGQSPSNTQSWRLSSRKSLIHYIRRSVYHLLRGQLARILKANFNYILEKYCWKIAYMSIPRRINFIRSRINYVAYVRRLFIRATRTYMPRVYLGRITFFLSGKREKGFVEPWYKVTAGGLDIYMIPGDHSSMWREPGIQIMAEHLKAVIRNS